MNALEPITLGYRPVWLADIQVNQTLREHLVEMHSMSPVEVARLSSEQCAICHDDLHSKQLGSFWVTGR